ncbi:hypothetical protein HY214_02355 [Candidatus Roizmanbacteria bacterium]|nr:hypothetical protein [Candidatus Roizmanbacteria bacterium]
MELDSIRTDHIGRYISTAGQALVCDQHVDYGAGLLKEHFPELKIREVPNPLWLFREQKKLRPQAETSSAQTSAVVAEPVKEEKVPASDKELNALLSTFRAGRRK